MLNLKNYVEPVMSKGLAHLYFAELILLFTGCASTIQIPSQWPDQKIVIDGKNTEWVEKTYLIEDNKLVVGFRNDSDFVYVLLVTNDRDISRRIMQGLTVWFDARGGDDKTFGIHYPIGGSFVRQSRSGQNQTDEQSLDPATRLNVPPTDLEILGPGKDDRRRMQIMETGGIDIRYASSQGAFVYEMKVPYAEGDKYPFSIRTKLGEKIGVGLETSQAAMRGGERSGSEGGGGGRGGMGGGGGRGGGRGGMGGGGRGGNRSGSESEGSKESSAPLKVWMKVQLAAKEG